MVRTIFVLSVVILGAMVVTFVGVRASDWLVTPAVCPEDMVVVTAVPGVTCVDTYEASPDSSCPHALTENPQQTVGNLAVPTCLAKAEENTIPWRFVTREEARQLCARSQKRLPTSQEWYEIMVATDMTDCVLDESSALSSGDRPGCKTPGGVFDGVGNVWEWVSEDVVEGEYNNRLLPKDGYVTAVDATGVAIETSELPDDGFDGDYVRTSNSGLFGMVRGGFYRSGEDGGIYALQANIAPTFSSAGIGFRCVK